MQVSLVLNLINSTKLDCGLDLKWVPGMDIGGAEHVQEGFVRRSEIPIGRQVTQFTAIAVCADAPAWAGSSESRDFRLFGKARRESGD